MTLKSTARAYVRDAITAFDRAPVEVALAVLSAVLFSYGIDNHHHFGAWPQMAVGFFIAFCFAWTATLTHAMHAIDDRRRWIVTLAGALVAAVYLLFVEDLSLSGEQWRAFMLVLGCALLVFAAPAWVRSEAPASLRLRRINGRFVLRLLGIGLYGLALFAGLALALAAVDNLFELKLEGEIYGHVFAWIMLVLVPWVVVGGLESYLEPLDQVSDVARVVHRLASFLVPPLIVLYYGILFVYAGRILFTGEMPKNLVSPMVLAAGMLTALAAVLFDPEPGETRTGHRILRVMPVLFLPIVPLGFWALAVRIDEYGWTEFRLLRVVALALLLALAVLGTVQLVRRRAFSLRVIPAVLGVAVLLSVIGPWSVLAFARRDQQERLTSAIRAAQVDLRAPRAPGASTRVVPRELYERINNTGQYLQSHFGEDAVPLVSDGYNLADRLGLRPATNDTLPWSLFGTMPSQVPIAAAAGTVYRIANNNVTAQRTDSTLLVTVRPGLLADIRPVISYLQPGPARRREQRHLPPRSVVVRDASGAARGELIVLEAAIEQKGDSTRIIRLEGVLILR